MHGALRQRAGKAALIVVSFRRGSNRWRAAPFTPETHVDLHPALANRYRAEVRRLLYEAFGINFVLAFRQEATASARVNPFTYGTPKSC